MQISHKMQMDMVRPESQHVDMMQGDRFSRQIEITPYMNGCVWEIPKNTSVIIRYRKPNNQFGMYDTLSNGDPAAIIQNNRIYVSIAPDVLSVAGEGEITVSLFNGMHELSAFSIHLTIHSNNSDASATDASTVSVSGMLPAPDCSEVGHYLIVEAVNESGGITKVGSADSTPLKNSEYSVLYMKQSLTDTQMHQARDNIGAISASDIKLSPFIVSLNNNMVIDHDIADIVNAYSIGHQVWCNYNSALFPLTKINKNSVYFSNITNDAVSIISVDPSKNAIYTTITLDTFDPPIKGEDYWTDADKAEIKAYVDQAILGGVW